MHMCLKSDAEDKLLRRSAARQAWQRLNTVNEGCLQCGNPSQVCQAHLVPVVAMRLPVEALQDDLIAIAQCWPGRCCTASLH